MNYVLGMLLMIIFLKSLFRLRMFFVFSHANACTPTIGATSSARQYVVFRVFLPKGFSPQGLYQHPSQYYGYRYRNSYDK